jgi:protein SFI1
MRRFSREVQRAEAFYDVVCVKTAMRYWKAACARIRARERKADKYLARQNDVLVLAVMRVWKAHERGRLLERVRAMRLLKHMWAVWKKKINVIRDNEGSLSL